MSRLKEQGQTLAGVIVTHGAADRFFLVIQPAPGNIHSLLTGPWIVMDPDGEFDSHLGFMFRDTSNELLSVSHEKARLP